MFALYGWLCRTTSAARTTTSTRSAYSKRARTSNSILTVVLRLRELFVAVRVQVAIVRLPSPHIVEWLEAPIVRNAPAV